MSRKPRRDEDFYPACSPAADRRHVSVALVPGQNGEQPCSQNVAFFRGVVARVRQRAALDPVLKQAGQRKKLDEESHLAERRHRRFVVPSPIR